MTLHVAVTAGFCRGVARAVSTVYREMKTKKLVTLGPIIHNRTVTDELAEKGVRIIHSLDEVTDETVVIRSHGVPASVEAAINQRGIPCIDCTCVDVKAIHRYAAEAKSQGRVLIVLGEAAHPEVTGYTDDSTIIIENEDDANRITLDTSLSYTVVAQTTYERSRYERIIRSLQERGLDLNVRDTICDATARRQAEAAELAGRMDMMIVLGDKSSANSMRLYEICRARCENTLLLASIHDLQLRNFDANDKIGITAGASTPPVITKEAIQFMSDLVNEQLGTSDAQANTCAKDQAQAETLKESVAEPAQPVAPQATPSSKSAQPSFEEMLDENFKTLHTGDVVKGTVIHVSPTEVTVNLGYKSDGIITRAEMTEDPQADLAQMVKPGDVIDVYVLRVNDGDGNVLVSKKRLDAQTNYKLVEQAFTDKTPIPGKVTEVVKGGLIAIVQGLRVFVPSSQISSRYVEDLSVFKGKEFNFNILEFDRSKRRIVAGRKELAAAEQLKRREELYSTLEIGQRIEGMVSRIVEFGAFVDLGGVDGLIHISELAWRRVRKVTDVLKPDDRVTVTVIDINPEKNKISLSLKDINSNPWNDIAEKYPIGLITEGKVARMASFGAFVTLEDGVDGLVHISQIADRHVVKPEDELDIGQIIKVKVTDIDEENHKISLSKRAADYELYSSSDENDSNQPDADELAEEDEVIDTVSPVNGEDIPAMNE